MIETHPDFDQCRRPEGNEGILYSVVGNFSGESISQLVTEEESIRGIMRTIVVPRVSTLMSGDHVQRNLGYLIFTLSKKSSVGRILIEGLEGRIVVHVTENFVLGAVLDNEAKTDIVDAVLARTAANLEDYLERLKSVSLEMVEQKIRSRSDGTPG
ncbi:MAG: hypothetical protein HXS41_13890 [Theionarchaea archaeon]|nr:hypothetical protein [Theionarchaea archaeon]MBU7022141.1 hypothetical protein [Theionarchaea archaeon]MBU7035370.1 hypothetical protein [Theionarchaea archaeon]MBU7040190.1 hypothetical protein [Theionarchaea archaeon]